MMGRTVEEISLNQWHSLQTMLYDGWVLRFSNGYTKRANSISPNYDFSGDPDDKIAECEKIYSSQGLSTIFKITPFIKPSNLDEMLEGRGYSRIDPTSIQVVDLHSIQAPLNRNASIESHVGGEWLDNFCGLNELSTGQRKTLFQMLDNRMLKKGFITLYENDRAVSCGLGIIERKYLGLFDVVTNMEDRNRGFGEQMLLNLLQWGKENGADQSWLAVMLNNKPALRLYSKAGFREIYRYWYRVKSEGT